MDDFIGRSDIAKKIDLKGLSRRSNARGALQTASHFGAIGLTGWLLWILWPSWWAAPVFVLHGMLLNYLFAAQHEFNHRTAFETRWINDALRMVTGFLLFYPAEYERLFHFAHHRHTRDWARDPEIAGDPEFTPLTFVLYFLGVTYWWSRLRTTLRVAFGSLTREAWLTEKQKRTVIFEAWAHIAGWIAVAQISVALGSWGAVILWVAPILLTKWTHQPQNLIEHTGRTREQNTLVNTRTTVTNPAIRWMLWNMTYHTAHHTFPGVPFHRLPEAHHQIEAAAPGTIPHMTYGDFLADTWARLTGKTPKTYPIV